MKLTTSVIYLSLWSKLYVTDHHCSHHQDDHDYNYHHTCHFLTRGRSFFSNKFSIQKRIRDRPFEKQVKGHD